MFILSIVSSTTFKNISHFSVCILAYNRKVRNWAHALDPHPLLDLALHHCMIYRKALIQGLNLGTRIHHLVVIVGIKDI